ATISQAGPLYRVVDSRLSISCNVSGFASNSARKEFEFRVKKPALPIEINIISTDDPSFSYAVYARRVRSKEITLTHVSPNSVVFEIQRLEKSDEGEYECFVINSESVYDGVYRAKTTVKVLDNSLTVSSPGSTSLSYNEGETLTLTCQASSNTVQHTHLSLAWYVHKNGEDGARPIISLDRDFTLSPGQGFAGRHQAGLIRLDKIGAATYNLKMAKLGLSDQGRIYCQAQEWVQDPDRSWYCIAQTDVAPTTLSLVVNILAQPTTLQEGQELLLSCSIQSQALEESFFSVAWLRGGVELARIGPTGILSVGPEYSARVKEGELRAARTAAGDYSLILQPVRTEDQGEYICRAWPQDRGQDGGFTEGAAHDSSSKRVKSGLSLQMQNNVSVNESDTLKLTCKVHGAQGQLSVTWQHKAAATPTAAFASVVSLNQEGVMEKAAELKSRKVKATRAAADTFILELDEVTPSDSGVYQCAVSEWKINSKISQSRTANVTVAPTESFVNVKLISRNNIVSVGETVELICRIRGLNVPATLTWSLQRDASTLDNILTQYSDGSISWSGEQHRYQLKVEVKEYQALHYLIINGVSHREAGRYQCGVSVFLDNVHKKLPPSNPLAVNVQNPVSKLLLTSTSARTSNINTDIEITCSVALSSSASSCYAVTWLLRQPGENKTIISSDRDALLTYGSQLELSYKQRIGMKRTVGPTFVLGIRQAQISDKGSYICEVVEWLQDPQRDWYQLSSASRTIELTLIEPGKAQSLVATEGDEVEFRCNIISDASSPSLFYKVSWLYAEYGSSIANALVELDHTGLLRYPENQGLRGLQERLRLSRPTQSSFYLGIHRAHEGDSGMYKCKIEQYQLDHKAHWQQKASESESCALLNSSTARRLMTSCPSDACPLKVQSDCYTVFNHKCQLFVSKMQNGHFSNGTAMFPFLMVMMLVFMVLCIFSNLFPCLAFFFFFCSIV
uniref:Ig-like domain-containing protein n=1 Tax=Mola mola TaxID=94237 RepID=A0A3Q3XIW3_MOLML